MNTTNRYIVLLCCILTVSCYGQYATIQGTINFPLEQSVRLTQTRDYLTYAQKEYFTPLDSNNTFSIQIPVSSTGEWIHLWHYHKELTYFVSPNDTLTIKASGQRFKEAKIISEGQYENNAALTAYQKAFKFKQHQLILQEIKKRDFQAAFDYLLNLQQDELDHFLHNSYNIAPALRNLLEVDILAKPYYYLQCKVLEDDVSPDSLAQFPTIDYSRFDLRSRYSSYVLTQTVDFDLQKRTDLTLSEKIDFIQSSYPITDGHLELQHVYALSHLIRRQCRTKERTIPSVLKEAIKNYKAKHTNSIYLDILDDAFVCLNLHLAGKTAPSFTLKNHLGETVNLSDYLGKVVVIDFWASWCRPCVSSIQKAQETISKLDDNIVFLFIGLENDRKRWKQFITKKQWLGEHVMITDGYDNAISQAYNLDGIPSTYVVAPDGTFAAITVEKMGDFLFENMLEELIAKYN